LLLQVYRVYEIAEFSFISVPFEERLKASSIILCGRNDEGKASEYETDYLDTGHDIGDADDEDLLLPLLNWIPGYSVDGKKA
jgi:hypothetical protein